MAASDESGDLVWRKSYLPFGGKYQDGQPENRAVGYTGHTHDDTGLVYMKARYYDPDLGRFYSNDPVGITPTNPMSFNRYAYANNNPYKYVDPDGRESRFAIRFDNRVERLYSGEITAQEYKAEMRAEGVGAIVGLSLISPVDEVGLAMAAIGKAGINAVRAARAERAARALREARQAANDAFKSLPKNQRKAIQKFFGGRGHEGLDKLEENFHIPEGLTKDALKKYRAVAENQIKRGGDKNGVQERRIKFIDKALNEMKD